MTKYVRIKHDREYWEDCKTGKLVPNSRHQDPCFNEKFTGDYAYPAPVPHFSKPAGGGNAVRLNEAWWKFTKAINTAEAWKALRRNNGGWINYASNKEWPGGTTVPDPPDTFPIVEGINSIDNTCEVLARKNNSTQIKTFILSESPPDPAIINPRTHPELFCYFRSISKEGILGDAPDGVESYFPLLAKAEAWIPDEKLEFIDELPEEPPMPIPEEPDFIDLSHHNGAAYKNNPLDWQAIRDAGIDGAIAKAWDGWFMAPGGYPERQHFDAEFLTNWTSMVELTLRGAFLYGRFDTESWRPDSLAEQVSKTIAYIPLPRKPKDILMLDIEQKATQIAHISLADREAMLVEALQEAESKWDKKFIWLYSAQWWWNYQMPKVLNPYFLEFPMVVAYYGTSPLTDYLPNGWPIENVIAHQYTDEYNIPGYPVADLKFDGNQFLWDWDEYFYTANPTPPPDPEPPEENPALKLALDDMQNVINVHRQNKT